MGVALEEVSAGGVLVVAVDEGVSAVVRVVGLLLELSEDFVDEALVEVELGGEVLEGLAEEEEDSMKAPPVETDLPPELVELDELESVLALPPQFPVVLMLCQLPLMSPYVYSFPQPLSSTVTDSTNIWYLVEAEKTACPPAHSQVPTVAGSEASRHPIQLPILTFIGVCGYRVPWCAVGSLGVRVRTSTLSIDQMIRSAFQSIVYVWKSSIGVDTGLVPPRS